ncbi:hypothetical protein HNY73_001867 [Argiope bruennichi]|uniref:Uncharacterized protein n=1 Tax=Argiope bruennichi TaxID=94029 RepID=A0A8T0FW12_ARGBR|nr:hypothetical protein HNY73_001867 [Argiope bruennichi]
MRRGERKGREEERWLQPGLGRLRSRTRSGGEDGCVESSVGWEEGEVRVRYVEECEGVPGEREREIEEKSMIGSEERGG